MIEFYTYPGPTSKRAILIFSAYHFVRDIAQTFNWHTDFSNLLHRSHQWCDTRRDSGTQESPHRPMLTWPMGPAFRSDPRSRPDQSTGYWLKNVFSTRAMSSGATTCPCPSSVCRSVWGVAAAIAFAARSKKSVGRPAIWGSVVGPSVVTRTD